MTEYIIDNDHVKVLGFQFEPGTVSYLGDILEKRMSTSKTNAVPKLAVYFQILSKYDNESGCLCFN